MELTPDEVLLIERTRQIKTAYNNGVEDAINTVRAFVGAEHITVEEIVATLRELLK
jgi:hypothetical protein